MVNELCPSATSGAASSTSIIRCSILILRLLLNDKPASIQLVGRSVIDERLRANCDCTAVYVSGNCGFVHDAYIEWPSDTGGIADLSRVSANRHPIRKERVRLHQPHGIAGRSPE